MSVLSALRRFADAVAAKAALPASGAPEDRLRAPFEALMAEAGAALGHDVACAGEARLPDRLGRPDFAIHRNGLLAGYAELKAPGKGADSRRFRLWYAAPPNHEEGGPYAANDNVRPDADGADAGADAGGVRRRWRRRLSAPAPVSDLPQVRVTDREDIGIWHVDLPASTLGGGRVEWSDGDLNVAVDMAQTPNSAPRSDFLDTLTWSGKAWAAQASDTTPTAGRMSLTLSDRTMTFDFNFNGNARLEPAGDPTRPLGKWAWRDSAGFGAFHGTGLEGVAGVQHYSNAANQRVAAAYVATLPAGYDALKPVVPAPGLGASPARVCPPDCDDARHMDPRLWQAGHPQAPRLHMDQPCTQIPTRNGQLSCVLGN